MANNTDPFDESKAPTFELPDGEFIDKSNSAEKQTPSKQGNIASSEYKGEVAEGLKAESYTAKKAEWSKNAGYDLSGFEAIPSSES